MLKGKGRYGFKVGKYDKDKVLYIDPLLASTYLGGSVGDWVNAIAIDSVGNVYVTGETFSTDFPVTAGAYDTTFSGNATLWIGDAFISKLDSNLSSGVPPTTTSTLPSSFSSGGGGGGGCTINPKANDIGLGIPLLILACLLWTRRRHLLAKKK